MRRLQVGRLDDDADDGSGPQAQEVRVYYTHDLEDSLPSQPANPITDCALGDAGLVSDRGERYAPVVLETGDNGSINLVHPPCPLCSYYYSEFRKKVNPYNDFSP